MANILKHKSWHVFNEKNIARVKADEKAHKEKLEKERVRLERVEAELRLQQLKGRRDERQQEAIARGDTDVVVREPSPPRHVNLFEAEEKCGRSGGNLEAEAEKASEKKKEEDKYTMYLGAGAIDKKIRFRSEDSKPEPEPDKLRKLERKKAKEDPLVLMEKYLKMKKDSGICKSSSHSAQKASRGETTIERLRRERLEREREEKKQVAILTGTAPKSPPPPDPDRTRGYNAAFFEPTERKPTRGRGRGRGAHARPARQHAFGDGSDDGARDKRDTNLPSSRGYGGDGDDARGRGDGGDDAHGRGYGGADSRGRRGYNPEKELSRSRDYGDDGHGVYNTEREHSRSRGYDDARGRGGYDRDRTFSSSSRGYCDADGAYSRGYGDVDESRGRKRQRS